MSAEVAANILWVVWYVTWIAAVVFSAKTQKQMKSGAVGLHRYLNGVGFILLFIPAGLTKPFGLTFLAPFTRKLWREPEWAGWSFFALVVAAFGFCWWARLHLGRFWSGLVTLKEGHYIVDTGPYGLVRHPIYSGVIVAALMTALLRASPAALVGVVVLAAGLAMTAKVEEAFLRAQLGADAYDAYRRKVPMLVPLIG